MYLRVPQLYPVHPELHLQTPGLTQVPLLLQPCEQCATNVNNTLLSPSASAYQRSHQGDIIVMNQLVSTCIKNLPTQKPLKLN